MLGLREIQQAFAGALFDEATDDFAAEIVSDGLDGAARLGIYRNNLHEGFIKALQLEFPVIERLVGADYFRQLALEFHAAHPSRNGNLHHVGEPLPAYLNTRFADTPFTYLSDVAALEWALQEISVAADAPPLDARALQKIAPEDYGNLKFELAPASRLVRSRYPVVRIWSVNQVDSAADETIDLAGGGDHVLALRAADGVEFHRLPPPDFTLLECFHLGFTLAAAFEAARAIQSDFNLGAALRRYVALGAFASAFVSHPLSS